ncbi:aminopeptidase P family N-terminal domain-containing protein [Faecalibacterium prausnitzii]|uniref:M24 family metallopeptidase n=1 Tax=Faecalibacterium prausnitzii TaxID=853 RepID=A0A6A8KIH1_9FIRM|nr:aminopeptidase P family N-terminal domain-containing protein [Faecalibacterium prausnitzii]MSC46620.1 M24 family metallopeptidase [Faecalibacterium prausnitzii]MSC49796.1 M24 family metallopeptidase [Faecalibacterium prausnitzii]MSC69920.1 M24 family metallopeptidase [Faecalibacterium prausnitzii]MSC75984.1 M24 family metallopeptidase [Faecalibacterium prausnitzii]MSC81609.1 M24 family metallopeptidase [Faecalibacterium prausnitzii]
MSMNTVPERLAALRAAMKANGVDVYLIPVGDPHSSEYLPDHYTSLTYFSGFHGENSNFVVTMTESAVWADGRYFVQAEKEIAGTEIQLMRMGEPGVPTAEEYCGKVLPEGGTLGLCGLTANCALVNNLKKALEPKHGSIKTLFLEDELWVEGRPARPATPVWILPKEYAGFSPAEKLEQLRGKLKEQGCTAQLVGKLDNLAWLLNLRAMDIECTPYAMAYCYVTPSRAVLFIDQARVTPEAKAELEANGVTLADYDSILDGMAAETEPQTVLAESATVNYAVYQVLENNPALTVKDAADPLLAMKGVKNEVELAHLRESHLRDAVAMVRFQIELESRLASGEQLTELTVDEILHKYRSADDKFLVESFGTIAAYGGNAAMMHYHATPEDHAVLQRKGFLLVDSGATYLDGTTDITRTYPLGELTEDERLFYTWTLQCHIDIAKAVWLDYCDCHMLDTIAREPLWRHLINYRCGTGHSVSFVGNVHEGPHALNGRNTTLMRPGMIVTDEPGVYEAGEVGIRIENEIECYHKADNQYGTFLAFRPLTFVPIATSPIVPGVLDKEQVAWLNDYHRKVFEQLAPRLTEDERAWLAEKCAAIGC